MSGSSLLTLGFDRPPGLPHIVLAFIEAALGPRDRRPDDLVPAHVLQRLQPARGAGRACSRPAPASRRRPASGWPATTSSGCCPRSRPSSAQWEAWFADIEESHTSNPALVFFRSPQPGRSWITAAGCILDTAAVVASTLDRPRVAPGAAPDPHRLSVRCATSPTTSPSLRPRRRARRPDLRLPRASSTCCCVELEAAGVPLKADRDQAWRDWAGWRVNYDRCPRRAGHAW